MRPGSGGRAFEVAAYILAGGRSSRFGGNKALHPIDGRPMVLHVADALGSFARPVTLVGCPTDYEALQLPTIPDLVENAGPLGGIVTALQHARKDWILVVACDMPRLAEAPLAALLEATRLTPSQAVVPRTPDGRLQPLCATYSKTALAALSAALQAGRRKLTDAFEGIRWEALPVADEAPFANVNRPCDLPESPMARAAPSTLQGGGKQP